MMKRLLLLLFLCLPLSVLAQGNVYEAVVVDSKSQQPLPYASVFVDRTNTTMTNAVGGFRIECLPTDMLRVSYVGYSTKTVKAGAMGGRIALEPLETTLDEVTVRPYSHYLKEAIEETQQLLRKHRRKKANFFYRQTAYTDTVCYEFMEAFFHGYSAVFLRDLELITGRFAGIQPDSLHYYSYYANFFSTSQIPVTAMPGTSAKKEDRYPLTKYYEQHYDVTYETMVDSLTPVLVVRFKPKPTSLPVLDATLYFDMNNYHLRKIEGNQLNLKVMHRERRGSRNDEELAAAFGVPIYDEIIDTDFHFVMTMTEDRGFVEVQSVVIDERHQLYGKTVQTKSLLFNIGDRDIGRGRKLQSWSNLHDVIEQKGYDKQFWDEHEIVRRTPLENDVLQLFESRQLFGIF